MEHGIFPVSGYASSDLIVFFPIYPDSWQRAGVGTAKPELPLDYWEFQQMMICLLMLLQVCLQEDECCDSLFKEVSVAWGREFVQQHRTEHRRAW